METSNWVEQRLASLAPPEAWTPDANVALERHRARRQEQWRRGPGIWWKMAMAAGVLVIFALTPPGRGVAQHLWRFLVLRRVEVVRVDLSGLSDGSSLRARVLQHPGQMTKVADAESARVQAGFTPRLPQPGLLNGVPQLSVMGPVTFGTTLKLDDLRQLLSTAGLAGETLPPEWEGASITAQTGGLVMAEWHDSDTMLLQGPPLRVAVPQHFDLRAFTVLCLRGLRVPQAEAERLGARIAKEPAWMLPIGIGQKVDIQEVTLHTGTGTMVYNTDDPSRLTLFWNTPDRIYLLSGPLGVSLAIAIANRIE